MYDQQQTIFGSDLDHNADLGISTTTGYGQLREFSSEIKKLSMKSYQTTQFGADPVHVQDPEVLNNFFTMAVHGQLKRCVLKLSRKKWI